MELVFMLIGAGLMGWLTNWMGNKKGRSNCFWWGFFLGLIGVIVVAVMSEKPKPELSEHHK